MIFGVDTAEWSLERLLGFPRMEMSGEGLFKQKEYGKLCVNKKGKVSDPPAVEPWRGAVGNKTPKEMRDHFDRGAIEHFLSKKIIQSKREWTTRNSMSLLENRVNPKQ